MPLPRPFTVVDAPSNLGLRPPRPAQEPGVRRLASVLRANRIVERLAAHDGGRVEPAAYAFDLDPAVGVRNLAGVRQFALDLADHLVPLIDDGQVPVVLGGDCSILLGPLLALRRRGRYGLAFIDGHDDLLDPQTTGTGGAAGMDLALTLGHGPDALSDLDGLGPLVQPEDVVMLGMRAGWEPPEEIGALRAGRIGRYLPLHRLRALGAARAADQAAATLAQRELDGVWIHLDADVLDNAVMPAVDSPQPGGLSYDELNTILGRLLATGTIAGLTITIYDPDLDPTGTIGAAFTDALVRALRPGE